MSTDSMVVREILTDLLNVLLVVGCRSFYLFWGSWLAAGLSYELDGLLNKGAVSLNWQGCRLGLQVVVP